ncbi:glycosyltransferase family 4 protein [Sphingomonas sp. C3-2]|uniref:glycosyltransferase family 4 protein n=1 Tax=Sphingomonas sp. C3-2 TaxID=3062169 RepID=UPI00294AFD37|nr:glycosyltransferase family 4 protein [Sphingomonas sp. C3-2]WOK36427.1 glycosyltransferase family 4 protein [Sphingomonas sp. C3-2]
MKIAITGLRGIPDVMGGVETHCEEMLPRVRSHAPDAAITVFARAPYVAEADYGFRGVRVVALPSPRRVSLEAIIATFNAVLAARRTGAEIIHIHAIGPSLLVPLARALGLKVVMTHHGEDYNRAKWGRFASGMLKLGERLGVRYAHRVIAVSPSLTTRLKTRFPDRAARIDYIPNGAPQLPEPRLAVLEQFDVTPGSYLLAVGRLVPEKGLHDLIDAHLASDDPRSLIIAGGADHESNYSRSLLARADERIVFAGLQDRAALRALYENAALFVMPSYHEGLPIAALEAASCGTPMLLSDIQPNRDLGLAPAHYFPVGNVDALRAALASPAAHYAVDAGHFRTAFDWDVIAAQTAETYRAVSEE